MQDTELLRLVADIVSAHVAHNKVPVDAVPDLILLVYAALGNVDTPPPEVASQAPAVPIKKSIFPGYIVCLEDGKKLKMLKRHLLNAFGMTPDQYRAKWGLPNNYPMTAPDYTALRSDLAKSLGLGRKSTVSESLDTSAEPELVMPLEVLVQKFPAKARGRKPGSKNVKPMEAEAALD